MKKIFKILIIIIIIFLLLLICSYDYSLSFLCDLMYDKPELDNNFTILYKNNTN